MKFIHGLSRWGVLYILVILMVAALFWENSLTILPIDHTLLLIGILIFFSILLNSWITHHETNLLVSHMYMKQLEKKTKKCEPLEGKEARLEKTK